MSVTDLAAYRAQEREAAKSRHPSQWHKQRTMEKLKELGTCPLCQQDTNKEQQ